MIELGVDMGHLGDDDLGRVTLPGWEASAGARLEREVASACGIPCAELAEVMA